MSWSAGANWTDLWVVDVGASDGGAWRWVDGVSSSWGDGVCGV